MPITTIVLHSVSGIEPVARKAEMENIVDLIQLQVHCMSRSVLDMGAAQMVNRGCPRMTTAASH